MGELAAPLGRPDEGTVRVSANGNLGNAAGAVTLNGSTLHATQSFTAARATTLNADGVHIDRCRRGRCVTKRALNEIGGHAATRCPNSELR